MLQIHSFRITILAFGLLSVFIGCGPHYAKTEMVEGIVTLDGQPVEKASISFTMLGGGGTVSASGETEADGRYRLSMYPNGKPGAGTFPGEYEVAVRKQESIFTSGKSSDPESSDGTVEYKDLIPKKYFRPSTSGLKATVVKGDNRIDFQLVSK